MQINILVDGQWSQWSTYGQCEGLCGVNGRTKSRNRTCTNPPPSGTGSPCPSGDPETQTTSCPDCQEGGWSEWSEWSACAGTCYAYPGSIRYRKRSCSNPSPLNGGEDCQGEGVESETCGEDLCPVHLYGPQHPDVPDQFHVFNILKDDCETNPNYYHWVGYNLNSPQMWVIMDLGFEVPIHGIRLRNANHWHHKSRY